MTYLHPVSVQSIRSTLSTVRDALLIHGSHPALLLAGILFLAYFTPAAPYLEAQTGTQTTPGGSAQQAEDSDQILDMSPYLVSGAPILDRIILDKVSGKVNVLTSDQLDALNANDLSAALRRIPGVSISRHNPVGAFGGSDGGGFFIRGHGSGRPGGSISTRVDGIARFNSVWTHPLLDMLSIDNSSRIEIFKSPQPAVFGNMAFGVVNLIPKTHAGAGPMTQARVTYGAYDTFTGIFDHTAASGAFDYWFTASHRRSDGHRANADGETNNAYLNIGYDFLGNWRLELSYNFTDGWANDPQPEGTTLPITERYETLAHFTYAKLTHTTKRLEGTLKVYFEDGETLWDQWNGQVTEAFYNESLFQNYGFQLKEVIYWGTSASAQSQLPGRITLGLDHEIYGGSVSDIYSGSAQRSVFHPEKEFRNTSLYGLVDYSFNTGNDMMITPALGVRYNNSRYFGDQWGAQANLVVEKEPWKIYANLAHSYNLAGVWVSVLYRNFNRGDQWQTLDSETIDFAEIGLTYQASDWLELDFSYFYSEVSDALRLVPPPPPPPAFANIGEYRTNGVEVNARIALGPNVQFFLGGTWNDVSPENVPNIPEISASAGMRYNITKRIRLDLNVEYVDEQVVINPRSSRADTSVPAYTLVNGRISYEFTAQDPDWKGTVFLSAENILDEDYGHRPGYPMPGANLTAGLEVVF